MALSPELDTIPIRVSSLPMWPDCSRRTAARYYRMMIFSHTGIDLTPPPPHIGAVIGSSVHRGAEYTMREKLEHGGPGSDSDATERALGQMDSDLERGAVWDDATPRRDTAQKQTVKMLRSYRQHLAPTITPIAVETNLQVDIGGGYHVSGHSDVVAITPAGIRDLKTGVQQRVHLAQLGGYSITTRTHDEIAAIGIRPRLEPYVAPGPLEYRLIEDYVARVALHKKQPLPQRIEYDRGLGEMVAWARINEIRAQVSMFRDTSEPLSFPANPNSVLCSPKFCPAFGTNFCREHKGAA